MLNCNKATLACLGFLGATVLGLPSSPASAATTASASTTFTVSATVQATCLITANPLAFGTYTGLAANATTTIAVTCTNTTPYNVGLDAGLTSGATVSTRQMKGPGTDVLNYGLYQDSTHATNWGSTVGTDTETGTGNGSAQSLTVYGQVPANQYVTPGSYSDTITATVTY